LLPEGSIAQTRKQDVASSARYPDVEDRNVDVTTEGLPPLGHADPETVPISEGWDREAMGHAMEACRQYLMLVSDRELDADLRAKGGASDLVQETFLEAYAQLPRFTGRSEGELRAWLRRILLNNVANFRRRYRATRKRRVGLEVSINDANAFAGAHVELVSGEGSPSHHAREQEQAHALVLGLRRLPENYRRVILWRHQEQLSFEEIGRQLGGSADAARMLWARAIKRLQHEIKRATEGAGSGGRRYDSL
jgi:RNA polymerase sigma-70 factor (ECF subfamily)